MKNKFLSLYRRNKDAFIKPKLHWFFGLWRNEPNLPVWRRGPIIRFGKCKYVKETNTVPSESLYIKEYEETWNYAKLVDSKWTEEGKKNHPFLSKFLKPSYELPIWLSFYIFNHDIYWKTKWTDDDFRYEYPTHFTIVFFGLAISVTAYIPQLNEDDWLCQDQYWESMLTYEYYNGDLEKTNESCGWYNYPTEKNFRFKFDPRFLKNVVDRDDLIAIQAKQLPEIKKQYEEEEKERLEKRCYAIYAEVSNVNDNKFDGWHKVNYKKIPLVYIKEKDCKKALSNIKKSIEHTKGDELKKIEYKMFIGNKDEFFKWKNTCPLYADAIIDKNIDMFEGIYKAV